MFIPVGDDNKRKSLPFFNYLLLLANVAVYVWMVNTKDDTVLAHALVPAHWDVKTILTSMFLHANLGHLIGNLIFLMVVGDNVEDRMGHLAYLAFYFLAGAAGSAAHIAMAPGSTVPTIGASGAISGVMGAFLVFFPTSRIKMLILLFHQVIFVRSWYAIGLWIVMQIALARMVMTGGESNIAVFAHLGGFVFGFLVAFLLRLFDGKKKEK